MPNPLAVDLPKRPRFRLRMVTVTAVDTGTSTCTVMLGGTEIEEVAYLLEPAVDDVVVALQDSNALLVLGVIGQTASGGGGGGGVTDHGALTGLADNDHPQYLTEAEADALYQLLDTAAFTRDTDTITTSSITDGADDTGTLGLAAGYRLLNIDVDRACRVRLYDTSGNRTADAAREIGTDVDIATDHGLIFEYVADGAINAMLSPTVDGFCPTGTDVYWRITNLSGSTSTVAVEFDWIRTE